MKTEYIVDKEELSKSIQDIKHISQKKDELVKAMKQNKVHLINSEIEKIFTSLVP
tara:strand:+ start:322 stop:486 length:165 start_codon:yes stop_codon:yes gene_type:complete